MLLLSATGLQVVERVFVGFETDDFDDTWAALRFLALGEALGLAVLPLRCERDLLDAWQKHRVEVVAHLNEDELALAQAADQINDADQVFPNANSSRVYPGAASDDACYPRRMRHALDALFGDHGA